MNHGRTQPLRTLRYALLCVAVLTSAVHANDYNTVHQLIRAGKLVEAQAQADRYLAGKPRDPQMRFLKGVIQREAGKTNDALATFSKLTEEYPELPEPYNNLAVIYASQGQYDKARVALEMAIRTNPSYATAHENLGDIYTRLASQAYGKALQLDASNAASSQPKLALIQQVFTPQTKLPAAPATSPVTAPSAAAPAPLAPAIPAPVNKPVPTPANQAPAAPPPPALSPQPVANPAAASVAAANATVAAAPSSQQIAQASREIRDVETAVQAWAQAWSTQNMTTYLAAYGPSFDPPGKVSRASWEAERRKRITGKSRISVKLENLSITVNENRAVAKFRQDYKADALSVSSRKTLELVKVGERWLIVRESTGS